MPAISHSSDFKTLFEDQFKNREVKEGCLLKGTVININRDWAVVDVGLKSEGYISLEEFRNFDGQVSVQAGDKINVVLEQLEDDNGVMVLSKERADALQAWDKVAQAFEKEESIEGLVVNKIKGGMSVNLGGIRAFLPGSQIDLKPIKSLDKLVGQKYLFRILKLNKQKGNIVLSRRAVLEKERESQRKDLLVNLREGQVLKGCVKNITEYGAFVDLGGIDGLLHITDMSWGRISHPSEVIKVGDEIDVAVLKYDAANAKVALGLKQLQPDPWQDVPEKFKVGDRLNGKVVNVTDYGVFIEVAEGIEGLVHISELTWSKKVKHPSKIVKVGTVIEAVVLDVDSTNHRISLGMKQLEPNPWDNLVVKYPAGTKVHGVVRNITDFGIFVGIEGEEIDGLVHISDISWEKSGTHPSETFQKGQEVDAIVLSVDKSNERFALGIKQVNDDPWNVILRKYPLGAVAKGVVSLIDTKGVVLNIEEGVTGFISNTDLSARGKVVAKDTFKEGDEISAQVKKHDDHERRLILSVKAYQKIMEKEDMKDFLSKQGDATVRLQDIMK